MLMRVDQYFFAPGCCGLCRSSNLPAIDTGIHFNHPTDPNSPNPSADDLFYICADCAIEIGRIMLDSRNFELNIAGTKSGLENTISSLTEANTALSARIEDLENALRVVNTIKQMKKEQPATKQFKAVPSSEVEV